MVKKYFTDGWTDDQWKAHKAWLLLHDIGNRTMDAAVHASFMPDDKKYAELEAKGYRWQPHKREWQRKEIKSLKAGCISYHRF